MTALEIIRFLKAYVLHTVCCIYQICINKKCKEETKMLLCSCPQGYQEIGPTCTKCRLPRRPWGGSGHWLCGPPPAQQHAVAMVQSEVACGMICRNSGERAQGCRLLRACLDRPHGASPHITRTGPLPSCKRGLLVAMLHHQKPFLQFKTCFNAQHESPAIVAGGDQLIQAPFVRVRKWRLTSEPGGFQTWGASLCPDDEVTRQGSDCC